MPVQPDQRWVAERLERWCAARDSEALGELLKWQRDRAFAVARRILGNDAEAEDAVQQAFLKLFRSTATFSAPDHFHASVYRSVTHSAIDLARNKQARRLVEHAMAQHDRPPSSTPGQAVENREALRVLQQEMDALTADDRALLALCCQEGLSLTAAAESLDLPRETARDRLARLLTDLRQRLARRGVALSLLLLIGLFQNGRAACASESLCATLNTALPGASCAAIAPATAAGVSGTALLAQVGLSGGLLSGLLASKALLACTAAAIISAGVVTWSATTTRPAPEPVPVVHSTPPQRDTPPLTSPQVDSQPAPVQQPQANLPEPIPEVPAEPVVHEKDQKKEEDAIPLADLPAPIRDAAIAAVPNLAITRVERETKRDLLIYDVKGRDGERFVEIELDENGRVLKIEHKDKDEDRDDDKDKKGMPPPVEPKAGDAGVF